MSKKVLVFFCGLAGVGKRTLIGELRKRIPNTVKFEKDLLIYSLLDGLDHTSEEYKKMESKIYKTLVVFAIDNLANDNTIAIMQAYYGNRLT